MDRVTPPSAAERGQILTALVLLLALDAVLALGCGSQHLASALGYHPALGEPLARLGSAHAWWLIAGCAAVASLTLAARRPGAAVLAALCAVLLKRFYLAGDAPSVGLYSPALVVRWSVALPRELESFGSDAASVSAGVFAGLAASTVAACWPVLRRLGEESAAHGSAALASRAEVGELLEPKRFGVTLGRLALPPPGRRVLRDASPSHVMVFAASQRGKSSGVVIPTLLEFEGSCIVLDRKAELWHATAGYRAEFSRVMRFDPTAGESVRFNPLLSIPPGRGEVAGAQGIARTLVDPAGRKDTLDFWDGRAMALLSAVILHVLYAEEEKSLPGCYAALARPRGLEAMRDTRHDRSKSLGWTHEGKPTWVHPLVLSTIAPLLELEHRTLSGIVGTAQRYLEVFADPVLAERLGGSDFVSGDFMFGERPLTLYLTGGPREMRRILPLVRLLLLQTLGDLTAGELDPRAAPRHRHPLLLVLDEFAGLGRLEGIESYLAEMAGYGIRALVIVQALGQIYKLYGREESITTNCPVKVAMGAADLTTARMLSESIGRRTLRTERRGESRRGMTGQAQRSVGEVEMGRPVMTADEILRMKRRESLIFVPGIRPIRGRQRFYLGERRLARRSALAAPASEPIPRSFSNWFERGSAGSSVPEVPEDRVWE